MSRRPLSKKLRFQILKRDGFACRYCGATAPAAKLHVDHKRAVVNGGSNDPGNLITACEDCNLGKHADDLGFVISNQRSMAVGLGSLGLMIVEYPDKPRFSVILTMFTLSRRGLGEEVLDEVCLATNWIEAGDRLDALYEGTRA